VELRKRSIESSMCSGDHKLVRTLYCTSHERRYSNRSFEIAVRGKLSACTRKHCLFVACFRLLFPMGKYPGFLSGQRTSLFLYLATILWSCLRSAFLYRILRSAQAYQISLSPQLRSHSQRIRRFPTHLNQSSTSESPTKRGAVNLHAILIQHFSRILRHQGRHFYH
jgi:hypothetical protein